MQRQEQSEQEMEYIEGTKVFTNWTIERELGEGAAGKVYEI